jgi:hypothetical protein
MSNVEIVGALLLLILAPGAAYFLTDLLFN